MGPPRAAGALAVHRGRLSSPRLPRRGQASREPGGARGPGRDSPRRVFRFLGRVLARCPTGIAGSRVWSAPPLAAHAPSALGAHASRVYGRRRPGRPRRTDGTETQLPGFRKAERAGPREPRPRGQAPPRRAPHLGRKEREEGPPPPSRRTGGRAPSDPNATRPRHRGWNNTIIPSFSRPPGGPAPAAGREGWG